MKNDLKISSEQAALLRILDELMDTAPERLLKKAIFDTIKKAMNEHAAFENPASVEARRVEKELDHLFSIAEVFSDKSA